MAEMKNRAIHSGIGHHAGGAVDAVLAGLLPVRRLVEPLAVGRLLDGRAQLDALQRPEHGHAPRVDVLAERAVLHPVPLAVDDRAGVADQLAGEVGADVGRQHLRRLDLLGDGQRLGLGAGARGVVALEAEEDQEAEEHGEPGGETPKMPAARSLSL